MLEAVLLHLLRQQVLLRDVHLLVFRVTGQTDDFHAIEQRRRNVQAVRRADEHHLRQVEIDLEVMVVERGVLLRVEHFEQRRGRIAAEVHRHLVDFVEQEQRIVHGGLRHVLHDLAGHGADVRAAMAADLGLVTHAAERHAHELAVRGARDALAERGLADARRTDEAQDGALDLVDALLDGQVLDDAFLDLLQPKVVFVQHLLGARDVLEDLGAFLPRHLHQPVDVVAHDGGFRRHRRHHLELVELARWPSRAPLSACPLS